MKRWPALVGPGLAGVCWFVDPVRFCDWARGLDDVSLSDATRTSARLSRDRSAAASGW